MIEPIHCKTLMGHWGVDFSITCLQSFIQNSEQQILLTIFEDGSLTDEDGKKIVEALPGCSIVKKNIRDGIVIQKLAKYPNCLYYRNSTGYAQKLFDIMLMDEKDVFYIDSDILFLKKFSLPDFAQEPVFMSDTFNAYSFQPQEFLNIKLPIYPYINSGFFYFPHKLYNLDYIELILNNKNIRNGLTKSIPWLEQTIWAFLAAQSPNLYYFDYNQIMMAQQVMKIPVKDNLTKDSIAIHLVGSLRGHVFPELQKLFSDNTLIHNFQVIKLMHTNKYLTKLDFAMDRLKKKIRQTWPKKIINYKVNLSR